MENTKEHITDMHMEDVQWKKDLSFYRSEIEYFRKRLAEVSSKNTSKEIKMLISHFENQFIIHSNVILELEEAVHVREKEITTSIQVNPVAYEHRLLRHFFELKGKITVFEKLFSEMKKEFNRFLSETM